jgi:putative tricarboxylic transport membrane protein
MWEQILLGFQSILTWQTFFYTWAGIVVGIIIGAIPGLTTTLGVALFLPFTFFMPPLEGIPFLIGIYKGGIYGGSIPAILINTPGTGAAAATTLDGYQLAKQGKAGKALALALYASTIGNFFSDVLALVFIGLFAKVALKIGRPDLFMIILFSCAMISGVTGKSVFRGLMSAAAGLFLSVVGVDAIVGTQRFTFGILELSSGLSFVTVLIGIFGFAEIITQTIEGRGNLNQSITNIFSRDENNRLTWSEFRSCLRAIGVGCLIGPFIGILPALGQPVAAFLSYTLAKRLSKNPEKFGFGSLEGVAAPEAGNNAVNGTTFVPLLGLGIPGDLVTAILLGALMVQGITPGPTIFQKHGTLIYGLLSIMIIANILLLAIGKIFVPLFAKLTLVPRSILLPCIILMLIVGSYSISNNIFEIFLMIIFGIIGYGMRKADIPIAPFVITFVLGRQLEISLLQSLLLLNSPWTIFTRPIAGTFFVLTILMIVGFVFLEKKQKA